MNRPTASTITDTQLDALHAALRRVHDLADQIQAGAPWDTDPDSVAWRIRDAATIPPGTGPAGTEATELETTARVFAALHRSAEQDVSRVIALYERWVKAGPPPLGTNLARWWDARLAELHDAIIWPMREQRERPTHPDGTPYRYHEIKAEGWSYCDGCRMWSTGTPDPHQCAGTHNRVSSPTTDHTTE